MDQSASTWVASHTFQAQQFTLDQIALMKGGHRITVVIPARNEAATIGPIVGKLHTELMEAWQIVDELLVIDSDSSDDTAVIARDCGATVYSAKEVAPELGWRPGKGEAMWKAQFVSTGDIIVFIDGDLTSFTARYVIGLLGPLLGDDQVALVKGFYDRDLGVGASGAGQGGRVTELTARPLISLWWPALSGIIQPLAGEWAARREFLETIPFPTGYGIECAVLIDAYRLRGLNSIAQVDLGVRTHTHQDLASLGVMAAEVIAAAENRRYSQVGDRGSSIAHPSRRSGDSMPHWTQRFINDFERPAYIEIRQGQFP